MFENLPQTTDTIMDWPWEKFAPYYADLEQRDLNADTVEAWLMDWTRVNELVHEMGSRLSVANDQDTTNETAESAYKAYLDNIRPHFIAADQRLKEKLLASELEPAQMEIPLRNLRAEADLFREANIPLLTQESKLGMEYDQTVARQSITWQGEEKTMEQAYAMLQDPDREKREQVWRLISARHLQDRETLNDLWRRLFSLRQEIAANAGFDSFRDYQWRNFKRFDYRPEDCETFHAAIEKIVVPAATRVYERHRQLLDIDSIRPWDLRRDDVYPPARPEIHAYDTVEELETRAEAIFNQVDPQLGAYFTIMRSENLLDLENRPGKAPGGYCTRFLVAERPFIFMNAVGTEADVRTLLHEAGHAFHGFEAFHLPFYQQYAYPIEFAEVASMSMELLSGPYWSASEGGYYSEEDTAHARRQHLENILLFWPYMAVVDAFQQWAYTHPEEALDTAQCDATWSSLIDRFIPGVDWRGLEDAKATGWHRKLHIFQIPFYYVDYGLAQLGAVQVWRNALTDQAGAVARYREGLALGGTAALPDLFATAGASFGFDEGIVQQAVDLIQSTLDELA